LDLGLAALIAAYHEADEPGGRLRATLPLGGRTLVERQVRLAAAAGADPVVLAVERVPGDLVAALDRLRAQGLDVIVARTAADAADAIAAEDRVLLVADGLLASSVHAERLLDLGGMALLTVPDARVDDRFERIDAHSRWAGLALIDGSLLHRTADSLGDWDLQSTLLRRAVQSGARQIAVRGEEVDDQITVAERADDLDGAEERLIRAAAARRKDWVSAYLLAPAEAAASAALMPRPVSPVGLRLGAALLALLALLSFAEHSLGLGMAMILLAGFAEGVGDRLGSLRLQEEDEASWWGYLLPSLSGAALVALASALSPERGWGCVALAGATLAFAVARRIETARRLPPAARWLAEHKGMAWLLLPFALFGLWGTGLTALALYAGASFFWAQHHTHAPAPAAPQD
jgi:hypothetical protein